MRKGNTKEKKKKEEEETREKVGMSRFFSYVQL